MPCQPWAAAILEESEDMGLKFEKVRLVVNGEMMSPTHPQLLPEEDGEALNACALDNEAISLCTCSTQPWEKVADCPPIAEVHPF
jgi:hypothetical protein